MKTNVTKDDQPKNWTSKCSGCHTKQAAMENGLRPLAESQKRIRKLKGRVAWGGNLDKMRRNYH